MFSLGYAGVNESYACPTHLRTARSTSSLVLLTFAPPSRATWTVLASQSSTRRLRLLPEFLGLSKAQCTQRFIVATSSRSFQGDIWRHATVVKRYLQFAFTTWGAVSAVMPSDGTRTRFLWLCRFGVDVPWERCFPLCTQYWQEQSRLKREIVQLAL